MSETMRLDLTFEEVLLLDGKCRPVIQPSVDQAREALSLAASGLAPCEAAMVAEIVAAARKNGRLTFIRTNVKQCPCCNRSDGYWPVSRTTRYKRRGQADHDKPKLFGAYDLSRGVVTMQNRIFTGFCEGCRDRVMPALLSALKDIQAEIPKALSGQPQKWKRLDNRHCKKCDWIGHEGQLGKLRTLMGDGWYPGKCPSCGAENLLFRHDIEHADGFALVAEEA